MLKLLDVVATHKAEQVKLRGPVFEYHKHSFMKKFHMQGFTKKSFACKEGRLKVVNFK